MAMPQHLKSQLFPLLVGCFGNPELFIQQSCSNYVNGGVLPPFDCIHFDWYNRYTTKVISPCLIYTLHFSHAFAGCKGSQWYSSLRASPWQHQNKHLAAATIYVNQHEGIHSNIRLFDSCILQSFSMDWQCGEALLSWISMIKIMLYQFQIYLPTDYNLLAKVVECLPGNTVRSYALCIAGCKYQCVNWCAQR